MIVYFLNISKSKSNTAQRKKTPQWRRKWNQETPRWQIDPMLKPKIAIKFNEICSPTDTVNAIHCQCKMTQFHCFQCLALFYCDWLNFSCWWAAWFGIVQKITPVLHCALFVVTLFRTQRWFECCDDSSINAKWTMNFGKKHSNPDSKLLNRKYLIRSRKQSRTEQRKE